MISMRNRSVDLSTTIFATKIQACFSHTWRRPKFPYIDPCQECREFIHSSLKLRSGLAADVLITPARVDKMLLQRFSSPVVRKPRNIQSLWNRQVTMRIPVVAFLLCLIAAGAVLVFSGRSPFSGPETIYVTRFPAVVVTNGTESVQPKN